MLYQAGGDGKGQFRLQIHTHLRKLHAHIGIQLAQVDGVEQPVIHFGRLARLFGGMDIFSQTIERDRDTLAVHRRGRTQSLLDALAGDEAGGHPASERGVLREAAQRRTPRECNQDRA